MAPEQALGQNQNVSPATDVYALGAILYEMLVGRPPFLGPSVVETLEQVRHDEPVAPTQLQPKTPRDLETVCLTCLQKDPARRYPSARALADDLRRFLRDEPVTARPVGALERCARWCRRNPRLALLSAAVVLLLVAVTVGSLLFAYQLDRRTHDADQARSEAVEARRVAEQNAADADTQRRRADDSARKAQDRFDLALGALRVVIERVNVRLERVPGSAKARQEIMQDVIGVLKKSVARNDPTGLPDRGLANAHIQLGKLLAAEKDWPGAIEQYEAAHAVLAELYREHPERDLAAGNYAVILCTLGDVDADYHKKPLAARARYLKALAIQEDLLAHPCADLARPLDEIRAGIAHSYQRPGRGSPAARLQTPRRGRGLLSQGADPARGPDEVRQGRLHAAGPYRDSFPARQGALEEEAV